MRKQEAAPAEGAPDRRVRNKLLLLPEDLPQLLLLCSKRIGVQKQACVGLQVHYQSCQLSCCLNALVWVRYVLHKNAVIFCGNFRRQYGRPFPTLNSFDECRQLSTHLRYRHCFAVLIQLGAVLKTKVKNSL